MMNRWSPEFDRITKTIRTELGSLTPEQVRWKPAHDRWSITEILQHVILLNESYYPILESVKNGSWRSPFIAKVPGLPGLFKVIIHSSVTPDRKRRMKTFSIWNPEERELPIDVIARFSMHQEELKCKIEAVEEWAQKGVVISSPLNRQIVYPLDSAFDIMISHEERHLEQCREIVSQLPMG